MERATVSTSILPSEGSATYISAFPANAIPALTLLADTCELCGSHGRVEVHHVRALKDLHVKGRAEKPAWVQLMAARRRKTLVVCHVCHQAIHHGRLTLPTPEQPRQTASEVTE